jgi:hypothetical protein
VGPSVTLANDLKLTNYISSNSIATHSVRVRLYEESVSQLRKIAYLDKFNLTHDTRSSNELQGAVLSKEGIAERFSIAICIVLYQLEDRLDFSENFAPLREEFSRSTTPFLPPSPSDRTY